MVLRLVIVLLLTLSLSANADYVLPSGKDDLGNELPLSETSLSLLDLTNDSMTNFACVNYEINGTCFWLKCTFFGCSVKTSMIVSHYNPDAVVEVIQTPEHPLDPVSTFYHNLGVELTQGIIPLARVSGVGQGTQQSNTTINKLQFHDAVAMGNPALPVFSATVGSLLGLVGWCDSDVMLYQPYFVSSASPEWRNNTFEPILGMIKMATFSNSIGGGFSGYPEWGILFPRIGFAKQSDKHKSAAVIASRVSDIITNPSVQGFHLAIKLPISSGSNKTFDGLPGHVEPTKKDKGYWQMNFPRSGGGKCKVFPEHKLNELDDLQSKPSSTMNYVWTLWRKYKCCAKRGQFYLGAMNNSH